MSASKPETDLPEWHGSQAKFIERGLASMEAVQRGAPTRSLEESMRGLRQRIGHARRCLTSASHPTQGDSMD